VKTLLAVLNATLYTKASTDAYTSAKANL